MPGGLRQNTDLKETGRRACTIEQDQGESEREQKGQGRALPPIIVLLPYSQVLVERVFDHKALQAGKLVNDAPAKVVVRHTAWRAREREREREREKHVSSVSAFDEMKRKKDER